MTRVARWVERFGRVGRADRIGVVAEFDTPAALLDALRRLRDEGYDRLDAYTPYRVEGTAELVGAGRSRVPWVAGAAGFLGAALAYLFQWWINVVDYPLNVGGRPVHSGPAFIPIAFETGVLWAGTVAFLAFFVAGGFPRLADPLFGVGGFESASVDGYWVGVDRRSSGFDADRVAALLTSLGGRRVQVPGGRGGGA